MGNFFRERLDNILLGKEKTRISDWKTLNLIILANDIKDVQPRGMSSIMIAAELWNNYKDKLNDMELSFIEKIMKGEIQLN